MALTADLDAVVLVKSKELGSMSNFQRPLQSPSRPASLAVKLILASIFVALFSAALAAAESQEVANYAVTSEQMIGDQTPSAANNAVRQAIEAAIAKSLGATRDKDIDAFMAGFADDGIIQDDAGHRLTAQELRTNILRDWKIIVATIAIDQKIDSFKLDSPTEATIETSQRWERTMLERDGVTKDHVVTTQRHRESWRKTANGWKVFKIKELGGKVWVNGKPYEPRD
jgi:hypothetical protein